MNNVTIIFFVHFGGVNISISDLRKIFNSIGKLREVGCNKFRLIYDGRAFNPEKLFNRGKLTKVVAWLLEFSPSKRIAYLPRFLLSHILPEFDRHEGGVVHVSKGSKYGYSAAERGRRFFVSGNLHDAAPDSVEEASKLVAADVVENIFKIVESGDTVVVDLFAELFVTDIDMGVFLSHLEIQLVAHLTPPQSIAVGTACGP